MTAEVALLNKNAIALAADSAVTFTSQQGQKIYNAGNKLFALSKRHPVGIMVYGNAEFMGVPWETIIKIYRENLGDRSFPTLDEYFRHFLSFLGSDEALFGEETQQDHVLLQSIIVFNRIALQIRRKVKAVIEAEGSISDERATEIKSEVILNSHKYWAALGYATDMNDVFEAKIRERYREAIVVALDKIFQSDALTADDRERLVDLVTFSLAREYFPPTNAGVVVAGFGSREHFPVLRNALVDGRVGGQLKYQLVEGNCLEITPLNGAAVAPFAQTEAVKLFVEGIEPTFSKVAHDFVSEILRSFPTRILETLELSDEDRASATEEWRDMADALFEKFKNDMETKRKQYLKPLLDVIEALPKDELAAVAEALVNITSLKRKVSLEAETVGGPIDVAVISKGDGLIWIRRKHYFRPELNPHFFQNYFLSRSESSEDGSANGSREHVPVDSGVRSPVLPGVAGARTSQRKRPKRSRGSDGARGARPGVQRMPEPEGTAP